MTLHIYSVLPIIMAAMCASVAGFELITWARMKGDRYNLAFAIICVAAAAYDVACAGEYNVVTPAASVIWLRIQAITLEMTVLSFFWYVAGRTRMARRWPILVALIVFLVFVCMQIFAPGNLTWDISHPVILRVHLPVGEVVYTEVDQGPLTDLQYLIGIAFFCYVVWVIIRHYRAGNRGEAISLLACAWRASCWPRGLLPATCTIISQSMKRTRAST
jgi:hypothetical protein